MIYAVIDTNVIVSALLTHNPLVATAKVLDFLSEGRIARKCPKSEVLGIYRLTYRRFLSILKIINP